MGTGLFPTDTIYKDLYDMTDQEIEVTKQQLKEEKDDQLEQQQKEMNVLGTAPEAGPSGGPIAGNKEVGPAGEAPLPPAEPNATKATAEDTELVKSFFSNKYGEDSKQMHLVESIDALKIENI